MLWLQPISTLFPYTTLFRSTLRSGEIRRRLLDRPDEFSERRLDLFEIRRNGARGGMERSLRIVGLAASAKRELRSEEHTSELQSRRDLVCRLLLEKKKY